MKKTMANIADSNKAVKKDRGDCTSNRFSSILPTTSRNLPPISKIKKISSIRTDANKPDINICPDPDPDATLSTLVFLLKDETGRSLKIRLEFLLESYVRASVKGFCIRDLSAIVFVLDNLVDCKIDFPLILSALLKNAYWPIKMGASSDVDHYRDQLADFYNFLDNMYTSYYQLQKAQSECYPITKVTEVEARVQLQARLDLTVERLAKVIPRDFGYVLMVLEDDTNFLLVQEAIVNQLTKSERRCVPVRLRRSVAANSTIVVTASRMLALCTSSRYHKYIELALLLSSISTETCMKMVNENILENILHRFNPYFPNEDLPDYDINPKNPHDDNLRLGDSSLHVKPVISLLLILLHNIKQNLDASPHSRNELKCPDSHAQRCWIWAFRLECRAPDRNTRSSLLVLSMALLRCFGEHLETFSYNLMPEILSLSVKTEVPISSGWTSDVTFNTTQADAEFKRLLIYFSVQFLKTFPYSVVQSEHWVIGLMYLVDPLLFRLRHHWNDALFAELRIAALQSLVVAVPLCQAHLTDDCALIRRILWYIEWYTVKPFPTKLLYWALRLMYVAIGERSTSQRSAALRRLSETHGVIVIVKLCYTLLDQKDPPLERNQILLGLCSQLLTSSSELQKKLFCSIYPYIEWPVAGYTVANTMLNTVHRALDRKHIISSRWTIALFNFIWESIIWKYEYRCSFISDNGIYKILDVVSMSEEAVQCLGLALVCDVARAGEATAQLVTWRARPAAEAVAASVVRSGASLTALLAAVAEDELTLHGVRIDRDTGVIENLDFPLLGRMEEEELMALRSSDPPVCKNYRMQSVECFAAAGMAGSRLSKVHALLQMLSDDLDGKVAVADETYNMYKNVKLSSKEEVILTLCTHYLVCKMGQVWAELDAHVARSGCDLLEEDQQLLNEFLVIYQGWAREIKYQQEQVLEKHRKMDIQEEGSLHELLGRCRLSSALDALKDLRRQERASNPTCLAHDRLQRAVEAHHLRTSIPCGSLIHTYTPPLDDTNVIGQDVKVQSIAKKANAISSPKYETPCDCNNLKMFY